jgi:hypothetical protein
MLKLSHLLARLLLLAYLSAHALAVVSLIAFGLRADGWVLHPVAVAWHSAFVLGSLIWLARSWSEPAPPALLVIPPLLALSALAMFPITALLGAKYAPYGIGDMDEYDAFMLLNFFWGLALAGLALLYRWRQLLRTGMIAQAALLATSPLGWLMLVTAVLRLYPLLPALVLLGLPLLYYFTAIALRQEARHRFPWEALAIVFWASVTSASFQLHVGEALPAAGTQIDGTGILIPDAWLPTIFWVPTLFDVIRWLLIPYALLGVAVTLQRGIRLNLTFPNVLPLAGVAWLAIYARDFTPLRFPLLPIQEQLPPSATNEILPLLGAVALCLAGRAAEGSWREPAASIWRVLTLGSLLAFLLAMAEDAWVYARVLFAPLPAWQLYWDFAPASPPLLAAGGLLVQLMLLGIGLGALAQTLRAWTGGRSLDRAPLVRATALPLLVIVLLTALGWWLLQPEVLRTVPENGAKDVPRDTQVLVELGEYKPWTNWVNGVGEGISAHYADTGDYIQATTGGTFNQLMVKPEAPLRPDAPIVVTASRSGELPYTFHFHTAGTNGPTATPMPTPPGFHGPVPTAPPQ